ncbi:lachesin isoform X2 [Nilaparvata lugens]|uniref:lachesin isoform X2 n=1 Tax=Nilaparvata lugens TaxID=108931 RepID=UPI00193DC74D|nr:lachesin isoform X2 [Nilaparvata lugens]
MKGQHHFGPKPYFIHPIQNVTVNTGREAVLTCAIENLGEHRIGWLRSEDQTVLSMHTDMVSRDPRYYLRQDDNRIWQLHIQKIRPEDKGCYMCQVNTKVMINQIGCIDVHEPPDIVYEETSSDIAVLEGDNATLECKAVGHPEPRVLWRREDGANILFRRSLRDAIVDRMEFYNGSKMPLLRVDRRQMGSYLCIASNDVPPSVSKRITLNVNFAPGIKVPNQLLGSPLGSDVHLECHVEAFPNAINYWVKNRGEILLEGNKIKIFENKYIYRVIMRMVIKKFSYGDIGTYQCISTNSLGKAEGTLRLYEIKLYEPAENNSSDEQASYLGGTSSKNMAGSTNLAEGLVSTTSSSEFPLKIIFVIISHLMSLWLWIPIAHHPAQLA